MTRPELRDEIYRLKAEFDEYRKDVTASVDTLIDERNHLKAEVERLRKAGDAMADEIIGCYNAEGYDPADSETLAKWNAAKEGKPSV